MVSFNVEIIFWAMSIYILKDMRASALLSNEGFKIKKEHLNKCLVPYTLLDVTVAGHHDCARECFNFGGECKAINYNRKNKKCELKYKGSDSVDISEFEQNGDYIFSDISEWPKLILNGCSAQQCKAHQRCLPLGNSDFLCVDKADCGTAPSIEHGSVTAPITTDGAIATYSCNFGYEMVDDVMTRRCKGGSWTIDNIMCTLKDCGSLAAITYGVISAPVTTHGETASYTCIVGYEITSGDSSRACVDGVWDGVQPTCTIKDCGSLAAIPYGVISAPVTTHGGTATYTCIVGYEITSDDSSRTCVDGVWDGVQPTCTVKDCGLLTDITYGVLSAPVTTHGGTATYTCIVGYEVTSGDPSRTCVDGVWNGVQPTCTIKDCGSLASILHGSIYGPETTHGATVYYECDFGYQVTSGYSTRTCSDGIWTGSEAVCSAIPNVGCYIEGSSELYRGTTQYTASGKLCQRWDVQAPHDHENTNDAQYPDASITEAENYCRNPDLEVEVPWCYTTDSSSRWEVCSVPKC